MPLPPAMSSSAVCCERSSAFASAGPSRMPRQSIAAVNCAAKSGRCMACAHACGSKLPKFAGLPVLRTFSMSSVGWRSFIEEKYGARFQREPALRCSRARSVRWKQPPFCCTSPCAVKSVSITSVGRGWMPKCAVIAVNVLGWSASHVKKSRCEMPTASKSTALMPSR